ncbi:MAG: hypothetical protein IJ365_07425, partial [Clostridia bacterium]|nr:hypothetical protein [Clostridia bacterium]
MNKSGKKNFVINMLIMTLSMLFIRVIGMAFNIYFTSVIGASETGMYHLMFSAYGFMITFSVAGTGLAATRLVTEVGGCMEAARLAVQKCLRVCGVFSLLATGICLLALLAGCGQSSTSTRSKSAPSDQSQKTGQTPQDQASSDKAETSSGGGAMSGGKSEALNAQTQTGSPSVPSSSQTSQTEPSAPPLQASNEAIRVMAYVKAMGGVANVPAKNLIVNSNLLALETVSGNDGNMKLVTVSGDQVMVTDEVFGLPSST